MVKLRVKAQAKVEKIASLHKNFQIAAKCKIIVYNFTAQR
jgi:hypothetical protein